LLDRLRQHGFRDGLTPPHSAAARMDTLLPILLDAFGDPEEKSGRLNSNGVARR
jgi:hypothetical protein